MTEESHRRRPGGVRDQVQTAIEAEGFGHLTDDQRRCLVDGVVSEIEPELTKLRTKLRAANKERGRVSTRLYLARLGAAQRRDATSADTSRFRVRSAAQHSTASAPSGPHARRRPQHERWTVDRRSRALFGAGATAPARPSPQKSRSVDDSSIDYRAYLYLNSACTAGRTRPRNWQASGGLGCGSTNRPPR